MQPPNQPHLPKSRLRKYLTVAVIAILAFFAFLLLLDQVIMPWYVQRGKVAYVPAVLGMSVDRAVDTLKNAGYEPIKYETRFDDKAKEGTIIRQTPEGGDETKPGRKVYLIISGGTETVQMPDLTGKNIRDARIALIHLNLDVDKTDMEFTDSIPGGIVFKQSPAPGTLIATSQKIDLIVSQGPRAGRVAVPDLTGMTVNDALLKLNAVKLGLGQESETDRTEGKSGTIYDQFPKPGELVTEGSTVDIFITHTIVNPQDEQ